jgi:hypothetical protein
MIEIGTDSWFNGIEDSPLRDPHLNDQIVINYNFWSLSINKKWYAKGFHKLS